MKIGHTGITWGIPGDVELAYRDVAELGYSGFETFTRTIRMWDEQGGGYRRLVDRFGIPTGAGYCYKEWTDDAIAGREFDDARAEIDALSALPGATAVVLQAGARPAAGPTGDDLRLLADALNSIGEHCRDVGLIAGLHPHTGTTVETRQDIDLMMDLLDPESVGFAPDTGQLAKGGSDILEVFRTYRPRIVHVHLKDWNGHGPAADGTEDDRSGYLNYEAVGDGMLPLREVLEILGEGAGFEGWVNVELDGTASAPRPPRDAAARSLNYIGQALGGKIAPRTLMPFDRES